MIEADIDVVDTRRDRYRRRGQVPLDPGPGGVVTGSVQAEVGEFTGELIALYALESFGHVPQASHVPVRGLVLEVLVEKVAGALRRGFDREATGLGSGSPDGIGDLDGNAVSASGVGRRGPRDYPVGGDKLIGIVAFSGVTDIPRVKMIMKMGIEVKKELEDLRKFEESEEIDIIKLGSQLPRLTKKKGED